jgi:glutamate dehydrogenase/leucine dehydrogenase
MKMTDEIGPEKIVHVHDPATGMKGVIVIDCTTLGRGAGGGIRMLPDITTEEIAGLARAMTYKFASLGVPVGGAKSGIWADPTIKGEERRGLMRAFGRAAKPLIESGLSFGADIGTEGSDLPIIYEGAELEWTSAGLLTEEKDGEPLENHVTGYGVAVAAKAACNFAGIDIKGTSVAIEGFGKVGGGVARYITEMGAKVVALSTIHGAIYNENGLDVGKLLEARKTSGDIAVSEYEDAKHLGKEEIFLLPIDILIPGARPYVITAKNAGQVQAKIISSIANIPTTDEAEEILFQKGVQVIPDFISNAGGTVIGIIDFLGGTSDKAFAAAKELIASSTRDILADAHKEKTYPRSLAVERITERILRARKEGSTLTGKEIIKIMKERLML